MLEFHPAANLFPLMEGDDFAALVADIAEHGQREPIVLHDGLILDGRNRYRACERLGLAPQYCQWDGIGSPTAYVISLNLHRRHLTSSQRAVIALDVLPMLEAEARERQIAMSGTRYDLDQRIDQGRAPQAAEQASTSATPSALPSARRSCLTTFAAARRPSRRRRGR
jgi:ParB-like chromosome segregation protein Spo0J